MTESLQQEIRALRSLFGSERDPEGRAFAPLADAYRRAGDFRQAVDLLREGLERHPEFVPGHVVAAQLFLEKGLLQEAEIASRRAVELDADNPVAWALLAGALEARGAIAQARDARARLAELEAPPASEAAPEPEEARAVADLAPGEPVLELADLGPEEQVVELLDLGPEEPVLELADLAPEEPVMELVDLAPEEPALELADLMPGEPVLEPADLMPGEPVLELADLGAEEPAVELVDLGAEEPVLELADLAPDEPVLELADLAPDEPVLELVDLAPEEPVLELADLAPDEPVLELADLAPEDLPSDELPDAEPLVTRTMAELYARQGLTERALAVFRQLLEVSPGDAQLRRRIHELESGAAALPEPAPTAPAVAADVPADEVEPDVSDHQWASGALEQHHDVETPFAWTGSEEPEAAPAPERTLGAYFQRMLAWEPGGGRPPEGLPSAADDA